MEQRKSQCIREMEVDRLSNLPEYTLEQILLRLSIKDAVRTSVLSSKWKHKWATLPSLVFNDHSFPVSASSSELVNIIDHVLLLHRGPIQKFLLTHKVPLPFRNIDRWIIYLSGTSIKEFYFGISNVNLGYTIPSCLFSCQNLTLLWLSKCSPRFPSTFKGLVNLQDLGLHFVTLTEDACEKLISGSHVLERMQLHGIVGVSRLNIKAPNLKYVSLGFRFTAVTFENTPSLTTIKMHYMSDGNSMSLLERLARLPCIKKLELKFNFIKCLMNSGLHSRKVPPKFCDNLLVVNVDIDFRLKENISRTTYVLWGIPNLQELNIMIYAGTNAGPSNWEEVVHRNYSFIKLVRIKISGVKGLDNEMDFIMYMLSTSPILETMVIVPLNDCDDKLKLVKELLCFERASSKARVILLDS